MYPAPSNSRRLPRPNNPTSRYSRLRRKRLFVNEEFGRIFLPYSLNKLRSVFRLGPFCSLFGSHVIIIFIFTYKIISCI
jgi:hypothetical protein